MDNLTHSLAGALIAEGAHDLSQNRDSQKQRTLLMTASILANNFPDLDSLYTRIMPPPLGYLLHHRGHTHTLLGLIPQAFLIFGVLFLFKSFRQELRSKCVRNLTIFIVAVGLLTHIMLDSWNSYGVHPFYPFSSKWFYGDLIFIVEPFIWFAFAAPLFFTLKSKWTRGVLATVIIIIPLLAAKNGLITWYSVASALSFGLIVSFFAQRTNRVWKKSLVGVLAACLFLATQAYSGEKLREQMRANFKPDSPTHKIIDLVLNPLPANPFCWAAVELATDRANDKYIAVGKTLSAFPSVISNDTCVSFRARPFREEMKLSSVVQVTQTDCWVDAWLRFARAPIFKEEYAFDSRFGALNTNFSAIEISNEVRECPRFVPPWSKPRQDLFEKD